jgi:hypothetical protein
MRIVLLVACVLAVGCSEGGVGLYKGARKTDGARIATAISRLACRQIAEALCAKYGNVDREYSCFDGETQVEAVACPSK